MVTAELLQVGCPSSHSTNSVKALKTPRPHYLYIILDMVVEDDFCMIVMAADTCQCVSAISVVYTVIITIIILHRIVSKY